MSVAMKLDRRIQAKLTCEVFEEFHIFIRGRADLALTLGAESVVARQGLLRRRSQVFV
jgi:hypothetical protein